MDPHPQWEHSASQALENQPSLGDCHHFWPHHLQQFLTHHGGLKWLFAYVTKEIIEKGGPAAN